VADTKQFVFTETIETITSTDQKFQLTGVDVTETSSGPGGAWTTSSTTADGGSATRYDKEVTNSSGNSETVTFPWGSNFAGLLTTKNGVPTTQCRVTFANPEIRNNGRVDFGNWSLFPPATQFPVRYDFIITEEVLGSNVTTSFSLNDGLGESTSSPSAADWPSEANIRSLREDHVVQGSAVTGGAKNTLASLETKVTVGSYSTSGSFSDYDFHFIPEFRAAATRSWEGNLYTIDGTGSDTIDPITVTATVTANAAFVKFAEASITTTASIVDGSINKKIATAPTMATTTTTAITTLFKLGDTLTFPATTNFIGSIHPLISGTANLTSTFAFEDVPVVVNAGSSIETTFTTTIQGNIISDVTGEYTWNSLSNNPFVESGYVKGGYTNDAEYEWDDLLNTDASLDATWDTWTYGTWVGDETSWDNWPRDKWNSPFIMEITTDIPTAIPTYKFAVGDTQAISSAFSLVNNAAFIVKGEATLTSAFACEGTAPGIFDTSAALTTTSTLAVSDIDYVENITSDEIEIFAGAFSVAAIGNIKSDQSVTIDSALTFTLATASVKYDIDETEPSTFTAVFTGNFKTDTDITLNALASTLQVGTLSLQPDPFNTITVQAETRTFVVPAENRQTLVMAEDRVNTISNETKVMNVMQETRTHKIIRPGFTDRFSTPRIRSET